MEKITMKTIKQVKSEQINDLMDRWMKHDKDLPDFFDKLLDDYELVEKDHDCHASPMDGCEGCSRETYKASHGHKFKDVDEKECDHNYCQCGSVDECSETCKNCKSAPLDRVELPKQIDVPNNTIPLKRLVGLLIEVIQQ